MARQAQPKEARRSREVLHSIRLCEVGEERSPIPGEAHWTLVEERGLRRAGEAEHYMTERTEDHRRLAAVAEFIEKDDSTGVNIYIINEER